MKVLERVVKIAPNPAELGEVATMAQTFEDAVDILTVRFPIAVQPAALREFDLGHGPYVTSDQYTAMDAWCVDAYGTRDADDKPYALSVRVPSRRLYLDRRWCIINGQFRFKTGADAIAFKLRWG